MTRPRPACTRPETARQAKKHKTLHFAGSSRCAARPGETRVELLYCWRDTGAILRDWFVHLPPRREIPPQVTAQCTPHRPEGG